MAVRGLGAGGVPGVDDRLGAEDRVEPGALGLLVEVRRPEEVHGVGDRHRVHAPLLHPVNQVGEADGALEEGVEGVDVEVREVGNDSRGLPHPRGCVQGGLERPRGFRRLAPS